MLVQAGPEGQIETALDLGCAVCDPSLKLRAADVVESVREDLVIVEPLGQLDCALSPVDGLGVGGLQHLELRDVAVGHGQLRPGLERLEQLDRALRFPLRALPVAREPRKTREPPMRVSLA